MKKRRSIWLAFAVAIVALVSIGAQGQKSDRPASVAEERWVSVGERAGFALTLEHAAPVWRDFGFSIGGRPKFLLPTKKAKFAKLSVGKSVAKGSPADTAGVKPGDIIEKIDGVSSTELTLLDVDRKLFGKKLGDRVVLEVRRPNEEKARTVELVIE